MESDDEDLVAIPRAGLIKNPDEFWLGKYIV